jgi:hypothetical protein
MRKGGIMRSSGTGTVKPTLLALLLLVLLGNVAGDGLGGSRSYLSAAFGGARTASCDCNGLDDCFNNCDIFNGKDCRITVPPGRVGNPCN